MDSSVSPKDEIWFLRVCHHISTGLYIMYAATWHHTPRKPNSVIHCYWGHGVKVKQSHYSPGQALRVPRGWGSQISRQSTHEGGKVVSPKHRPPLPQEIFLVLIRFRGWVEPRNIVRPDGLCQWKIPMTPSGIEPATLQLVAQCINQLRHQHHAPSF